MRRLIVVIWCISFSFLGTPAWGIGFDSSSNYFDALTHTWGLLFPQFDTKDGASDRPTGKNAASQMDWTHRDGSVSYEGQASLYNLRGKLSNYSDATSIYSAYGASGFWDEIYFETVTGDPAELVFNFNMHVDFTITSGYIPGDDYDFTVYFGTQDWDENGDPLWDPIFDYTRPLRKGVQVEILYEDFNGILSFSTLAGGYLVDSGTYLPIQFKTDAFMLVPNASIDWFNTFQLDSIDAYLIDDQGERERMLSADEYTLYNTSQIPEPTTLALMGLGLAGIGYKRYKAA